MKEHNSHSFHVTTDSDEAAQEISRLISSLPNKLKTKIVLQYSISKDFVEDELNVEVNPEDGTIKTPFKEKKLLKD